MTEPVNAPSTAQILASLAAGLLPLAGPEGIAVASLAPAVGQLYDLLTSHPDANFSIADLIKIVTQDNAAGLAKLTADVEALPS